MVFDTMANAPLPKMFRCPLRLLSELSIASPVQLQGEEKNGISRQALHHCPRH
jgi:hypothetical protein